MARRIWIVCLSLALAGIALPTLAQEGLLEDLYGRGVHAFFQRKYEEAHGLFTKAITSGLEDPRAHYFRGLTYLRLGRPEEAQADFKTGAELEAVSDEPVNASKALERVQGAERQAIEKQRQAARVALRDKQAAAAKARYEERIEAEKRVLLPKRTPPAPGAAPVSDETDPFKAVKPGPLPAAPSSAKPATVPAESAPPATTPAASKPATPAPADPPAAAAEPPRGSVFGSLFRAVKKGIPGDAAGAGSPKPAAVPAGDPNAPDPFADPGAAKPAPPKPAAPKPAPAPAGAKPAAAKPATDDPFAPPK